MSISVAQLARKTGYPVSEAPAGHGTPSRVVNTLSSHTRRSIRIQKFGSSSKPLRFPTQCKVSANNFSENEGEEQSQTPPFVTGSSQPDLTATSGLGVANFSSDTQHEQSTETNSIPDPISGNPTYMPTGDQPLLSLGAVAVPSEDVEKQESKDEESQSPEVSSNISLFDPNIAGASTEARDVEHGAESLPASPGGDLRHDGAHMSESSAAPEPVIMYNESMSESKHLVQRPRPRRSLDHKGDHEKRAIQRSLNSSAQGEVETSGDGDDGSEASPKVKGVPAEKDPKEKSDGKDKGTSNSRELREIAALAIPALGSVIADPLMSLVDTGCVGQLSSVQLAALGPNTAIFNFVFQVFAFLGVATTNLIATNSPAAPGLSPEERRRRRTLSGQLLSQALTLAVIFGVGCCAIMRLFPRALLGIMGASPEMLPHALVYLQIRALASPAVMVMCVAQGACLGQQDAWTPLKIFLTAGLFNLVGDVYLILGLEWGIAGAAWATMAAQYVAAAFFLVLLWRRGRTEKGLPLGFQTMSMSKLQPFVAMSGALVSRTALQMTGYAILTYHATKLGLIASAAHQVTLQMFWFFSYFPEPLSITAQSLIARDARHPARMKRVARLLLTMGSSIGLVLAGVIWGAYTFLPRFFTSDELVASAIRALSPQAFLSIILLCSVMVLDGISIGANDYSHLPRTSLVATGGCWIVLDWSYKLGFGLNMVWWGMVLFFGLRFVQHAFHVATHWHTHPLGDMRDLVHEGGDAQGLTARTV